MAKKVVGIPERCIGCHTCEQACTFANFGEANVSKARLKVHSTVDGELQHHINICSQSQEAIEAIEDCSKDAVTWNREENKIEVDGERYPEAKEYLEECPADSVFKHKDVPYPLVCKLALACVRWCPTGALKVKEVEE